MKQKITLAIFCISLALLISSYATGPAANGLGNLTGATGSSGCSCHGSTNSIGTTVQLDSAGVLVTTYHPGVAYTVVISATNNTAATNLSHFGFQVSVVKSANAGTSSADSAGVWGTLPANTHHYRTGTANVVEHSDPIAATTGSGGSGTTYVESIPWTAPAAGTGSIKIYGVLNAVNFDNTDGGDYPQVASAITISEATPVASVSISLTSGSNPACAGSRVGFTAVPTNGGTAPSYQWKIGNTNVGTNSDTFSTTALTNGQIVTCVMTSNLGGVSGSPATSNAITMTIDPAVTPSVSISTPSQTVCAGSDVVFTATPTNGGTPSYQWKVGTTDVGSNSDTFSTSALSSGQIVTCVMTSTASCASPASVTSNSLTMTVSSSVVPLVRFSLPGTTCAGSPVTFTAGPTNGGASPSYQWSVNGTNVGTDSSAYTTSSLTNGAVVRCVMTSDAACAVPDTASFSGTVTITPLSTPAVNIITATTSVCPGSPVTFTPTPINGGTAPTYKWKVNGTTVSTLDTFTTSTLTNGAVVTCVMTSNLPCASPDSVTSNALTMSVASQVPAVSISAADRSICNGAADTFSAVPTNGGTSPTYVWKLNGTTVGSNSPVYIGSALTNGSIVKCTLTSSLSCASPATVSSNSDTVTVIATVTPVLTVHVSHDTICQGLTDSFTVTGTNLGASPVYQWEVNSSNAGTNSSGFTSSTLANNSVVKCVVTSSATCASPQQVTTSGIQVTVDPTPSVMISPSGAVTLCAGDSLLLTASGASSYLWSNADTAATIMVYGPGTFDVTGRTGVCTAAAPTPATVAVDTPAIPVITKHGNVLTSTIASGYQWILNDTLTADTMRTDTMTESGQYIVVARDAHGCYGRSISYFFTYTDTTVIDTSTSISGADAELNVKLYPVPNQGSFVVESEGLRDGELTVYDIYGQKLYQQRLSADITRVSGIDLAAAVYFVTITDNGRTRTLRMEVNKE